MEGIPRTVEEKYRGISMEDRFIGLFCNLLWETVGFLPPDERPHWRVPLTALTLEKDELELVIARLESRKKKTNFNWPLLAEFESFINSIKEFHEECSKERPEGQKDQCNDLRGHDPHF